MNPIVAPRGTADIIPPETTRWQAFETRARAIAKRFGYAEIRTPTFEATELFVRGVGEATDIVEKEMYTFLDKGDRSLTLRPEWTAPVVRAALEHQLLASGGRRLFYIGPIYRYERPQAGRYRQAHQFGVECFGYARPEADAEVIQLAAETLRSHGIQAMLHLNTIGCAACRGGYREALVAYFTAHREELSEDSRRRLERNPLRLLDSKAPEDRALVAHAPTLLEHLCSACREHFAAVVALLEGIGFREHEDYVLNPRIVRGLDYYDRTVFEFVSEHLGAQSTVCAGGRYDGLVSSLGGPKAPSVPAVGFALGIERLLMLAPKGSETEREGIAVIALGNQARESLVKLVAALRRDEDAPPVTMEYDGAEASLSSQIKRADRAGARLALIAGEDELASGTLLLRDLQTRTQEALSEATLSANAPEASLTIARRILDRYRAVGVA